MYLRTMLLKPRPLPNDLHGRKMSSRLVQTTALGDKWVSRAPVGRVSTSMVYASRPLRYIAPDSLIEVEAREVQEPRASR